MKKLLILLVLLFAALPVEASWTLVQHPFNNACTSGTSTCTVTMTQNTGSNNLLVFMYGGFSSAGTPQLSSINAGGTFVHCSNCSAKDTNNNAVDAGYVLQSTSGVGSITVTMTAVGNSAGTWVMTAYEYSTTLGPPVFDASGSGADTACTSCAGQALTLGGANDAIGTVVSPNASCSTVTSPYTNPNDTSTANAAGAINTASGSAPTFTCVSGTAAVAAMAFKETAAAGAPNLTLGGKATLGGKSTILR
jgi:hypothetical protein